MVNDLQNRLGVTLEEALLKLAFSHPSAVGEGLERTLQSNQRLEFLGDALVGAIVAEFLYRQFPDLPEGALTQRKIASVRREALAAAAKRLDLGRFLAFGRGEEAAGGRERLSNLSDAFEALVGASFLSVGWEKTRAWVVEILTPELQTEAAALIPVKNRLQELSQALGLGTPVYKTGATDASGKHFSSQVFLEGQVRGSGLGKTKKAAEDGAANRALAAMQGSQST